MAAPPPGPHRHRLTAPGPDRTGPRRPAPGSAPPERPDLGGDLRCGDAHADVSGVEKLLDRLEDDEFDLVAVGRALLADPEPGAVARYSDRAPYDTEVVEAALARLGGRSHPLVPLLKGRLAAARR